MSIVELEKTIGPAIKFGQNIAFKNKWVSKVGNSLVRSVESIPADVVREQLVCFIKNAASIDEETLKELKKRKLIEKSKSSSYLVRKGSNFSLNTEKLATEMTAEMVQTGSWKKLQFKDYNLINSGLMPPCGNFHPLMKVREEFRKIFLEMGYVFFSNL